MIRVAGNALSLLLLVAIVAGLAWSAGGRSYNPDEFQHVQMAWLIAIGQVPYRDFFEHHTPLYHFLIAPLLSDPEMTTDVDAAVGALLSLRWIGVAGCAVMIVLTEAIGRRIASPLAARCGSVALGCSIIFLIKGLEIRPDQLGACLMLVSSLALVLARDSRRFALCCLLAGAAAALAVLSTQKVVFAFPGLAVAFVAACWQRDGGRSLVKALGAGLAGAVVATAPMALWFAQHGALDAFVHDNFLLGAKWIRDTRPLILTGAEIARDETLVLLFATLGGIAVAPKPKREAAWIAATLAPMASMALLMPAFPVVQPQYLFLFAPYGAILAGIGAAFLIERVGQTAMQRAVVATLVVGALGLHGALALKTQSTAKDETAIRTLRHVVANSPPDATVLRAWSAGVAFREPAFRYFSLHPEIRALVTPAEWSALARGLRDGSIAPQFVEMDTFMRELPPEVVSALDAGWQPTGVGDLWVQKPAR